MTDTGTEDLFSPKCPDLLWGPPSQWVTGTLSLGLKQPTYEADYSSSCGAEVKREWNYSCAPTIWLCSGDIHIYK
jgi:hypothetical protein